jgi:hypothetical protein
MMRNLVINLVINLIIFLAASIPAPLLAQHGTGELSSGKTEIRLPAAVPSRTRPRGARAVDPQSFALAGPPEPGIKGSWYYRQAPYDRAGKTIGLVVALLPDDLKAEREAFVKTYAEAGDAQTAARFESYIATVYLVHIDCAGGRILFSPSGLDLTATDAIAEQGTPDDWQVWRPIKTTPWTSLRARVCRPS